MKTRPRINGTSASVIGQLELVSLYDVDPFDFNPRSTQNAKWLELKESIRAIGVRQPVAVGIRPETGRLTIMRGGNTRHAVLLELHKETGDERYCQLPCIIEPWGTDLAALTAHIIENEHREGFRFIDRARAFESWRRLKQASQPDVELSYRQIAALMQADGCLMNHRYMGLYDYTLARLSEVIPNALYAGLGRPQISLIKRIDEIAERIWVERHPTRPESYFAIFAEALAATDVELINHQGVLKPDRQWDVDHGRRVLEAGLASALRVETRLITLELGARLDDAIASIEDDSPDIVSTVVPSAASNVVSLRVGAVPALVEAPRAVAREASSPVQQPTTPANDAPQSQSIADSPKTLALIRSKLRDAGLAFAKSTQLMDCVRATDTDCGSGYRVVDFPSPELCEAARQKPPQQQHLSWAFWSLVNCCDLFLQIEDVREQPHSEQIRRQLFGSTSRFVKAWRSREDLDHAVNTTVGPLEAAGYGDFVDLTTPEQWQAYLQLQVAYKQFRSYANEHTIDVFKAPAEQQPERGNA